MLQIDVIIREAWKKKGDVHHALWCGSLIEDFEAERGDSLIIRDLNIIHI